MSGWIKLHRKFLNWEWYDDANVKILFLHLLLEANYRPSKWRGQAVEVGQVFTGLLKLSKDTGLSVRSIRTALTKLKSTNDITIKSTNKFSIITLVNYASYQEVKDVNDKQNGHQNDKPETNERQANDNIQEVKNIRNKENKELEREGLTPQPPTVQAQMLPAKQKPKTSVFLPAAISKDEYQAMLADPTLANGDREFLKGQVQQMADWSKSGSKRKSDWAATLRNWIRKSRQSGIIPNGVTSHKQPKTFAQLDREDTDNQIQEFLRMSKQKEIQHA